MMEMRLSFKKGNLYAEDNGNTFLIASGSPKSFGRLKNIEIEGKSFPILNSFMGLDSEKLSEVYRLKIDAVIGLNILNEFDVIFDLKNPENGKIEFSKEIFETEGIKIPITVERGVFPALEVSVSGESFKMFFDTAAAISYLEGVDLKEMGGEKEKDYTDYYHGIGTFTTETYRLKVNFGKLEKSLRFGRLPKTLGEHLKFVLKKDGIIGNEFFLGSEVLYSSERKFLIYKK